MKIFAKNNTELENIFKRFHEQMENEKLESFKMIEDFTGVRPINVGYYWYFGITCVLAEDIWKFSILSVPNKNVILYTSNEHTYFKPNKRLKISKEFIKNWKDKFKGIDGNILSKYGIPVYDEKTGIYCNWIPIRENDNYGIEVPSSLFDRMPKIDNKQYEIEM